MEIHQMKRPMQTEWRYLVADTAHVPMPASETLPAYKKLTTVIVQTTTRDKKGRIISFATPSSIALALNSARLAVEESEQLFVKVREVPIKSPLGDALSVSGDSTTNLFDYFERCMIVATFSFHALETFCNLTIGRYMEGTYPYKGRNGTEHLSGQELELRASTEDKLGVILPRILNIDSPKEKAIWADFKKLKKVRDEITHPKFATQTKLILSEDDLDCQTLYY